MSATGKSQYHVRGATAADVPCLAEIERSAGHLFRKVGLDAVADDEPMPASALQLFQQAGYLWVATTTLARTEGHEDGDVVAFLAAFDITEHSLWRTANGSEGQAFLHIAELSVHADHQRQGVGRQLMEHFLAWSQSLRGLGDDAHPVPVVGLSLTTYRHLAFNRPFYVKYGFQEIEPSEIVNIVGQKGKDLWDAEQKRMQGRQPEHRCWMIKRLDIK